jgi:hypothetical protein
MRSVLYVIAALLVIGSLYFLMCNYIENKSNIQAKTEIESLKKKFRYSKDEFEKYGYYDHLYFANGEANTFIDSNLLTVRVYDNGEYYLRTNYYGDTSLNHHQIILSCNGIITESSFVENVRGKKNGKFCESIYLQGGKDDFIARFIGSGSHIFTSKIRFVGEKYNKDIVLSHKNCDAINECMELSDRFKKK